MTTEKMFRYLLFTAMIVMLPLVSACGSDDDEPEPQPEPETTAIDATYTGTTVTTHSDDPSTAFTSTSGTYRFVPGKDGKKATLCIENAHFIDGMPELGMMEFKGISYTIKNNGTAKAVATFSCDALTPEIANRPFPAFPITDLTATMHPGKSLELNFVCTFRGTPFSVEFTGVPQK